MRWFGEHLRDWLTRIEIQIRESPTATKADAFVQLHELQTRFMNAHRFYHEIYSPMYESSDSVKLLNQWGGDVFMYFQALAEYHTIMEICVLLDNPGGIWTPRSLTLYRLADTLRLAGYCTNWCDELIDRLNQIRGQAKKVRGMRHQTLAHWDLKAAIKKKNTGPTIGEIDQALSDLAALLDDIQEHVDDTKSYARNLPSSDPESLIGVLKMASEERQRMLDG